MSIGQECLDELDLALVEAGNTVKLRRFVGIAPNQAWHDVDILAAIRAPTSDEIVAGYAQNDWVIITTPTQIANAQWPGGQPPGTIHPELPRAGLGGDKVFIFGIPRQLENANPIPVDNMVVRIELRAKG